MIRQKIISLAAIGLMMSTFTLGFARTLLVSKGRAVGLPACMIDLHTLSRLVMILCSGFCDLIHACNKVLKLAIMELSQLK